LDRKVWAMASLPRVYHLHPTHGNRRSKAKMTEPDEVQSMKEDTYESQIKPPSACSEEEIRDFEGLVLKGEEVVPKGLRRRIELAAQLAFLYTADRRLAGVGALKRPSLSYRNSVFEKAASSLKPDTFQLELGWLFIEESHRGKRLSGILVKKLLSSVGETSIYATTREQNVPMRRILESFAFAESGIPYGSVRGPYKLILDTRPAEKTTRPT